jgi:hypothetical protein
MLQIFFVSFFLLYKMDGIGRHDFSCHKLDKGSYIEIRGNENAQGRTLTDVSGKDAGPVAGDRRSVRTAAGDQT